MIKPINHILLLLTVGLSVAAQPRFSQPHGLYSQSNLTITIEPVDPAAEIHYTTDGSEPTAASSLYTSPLTTAKTMILRAVEVKGGVVVSPVRTASYIFFNSVLSQSNTPEGYPALWGNYSSISGQAVADYEMDSEMTEDAALRPKIIEGLSQLPVLSIVTDKNCLFSHENDPDRGGIYIFTGPPVNDMTGHGWTRPASLELLGGPQQHDLTVSCGLRLHGGHGRLAEKNPKHSFRLVFKEQYGPKSLKYPVFGEEEPKKFDQLVLRCHFGNSWQHWDGGNRQRAQYTRDVWARRMQRRISGMGVNALYVHLFLNGMYWGLYNLAERVDDQFGKSHLGGEKEDIDVIKIEESEGNHIEAAEGTIDAWKLMTQTANRAANDEAAYQQLDSLLDIDYFIDYMLINQYGGNTDWDHHNWYAIRRRNTADETSRGFRFLCWDTEIIFEDGYENNLSKNNGKESPTGIFNSLLRNPKFARRYVNRAKELLVEDGLLGQQSVVELWDSLYHTIDAALYDEAARWGDYRRDVHQWQSRGSLYNVDNFYMKERNRLLNQYFPYRTYTVLRNVLNYVDIDPTEEFEAPADWVPFTASMFHLWDGTGPEAKITNMNPGAELNLNANLSDGAVVAGFSSVTYNLFADVSNYDRLVIRGNGGQLRIIGNRLTDHGDFKEVVVTLDNTDSRWNPTYEAVVLPLSELRLCNTKREGAVRRDDFAHLNAIKVQSGNNARVSGIWLVPGVETPLRTIRQQSSDGQYYNLNGQKVARPVRGRIYIRDGRKVMGR